MSTDDTPWQESIDASRAFLGRAEYGDPIYRAALDSIAERGVELPEKREALIDDDLSDSMLRGVESITRLGLGYKTLCGGLAWLVSELLAEIERDTGVSQTETLSKVEGALHRRTTK